MQHSPFRPLLFGLMLVVAGMPATARSQENNAPAASDSALVRAQQLVNMGRGDAGRAIVDSLLAAASTRSPRYAEFLFWHASLAPTAAVAEHDYRRLAVEFPLSGRAEDALLRLAQLEIARNDMALALRHLERLILEHPTSPARTRATYWMGRIYVEQGDVAKGCASFAAALAAVSPSGVELRNQIDFHAQRCDATNVTPPGAAPAPVPSPAVVTASVPQVPVVQSPVEDENRYAIQVAAFSSRTGAEELRARLRARGHDARITGEAAPFRVRVGRYATRAEAKTRAQELIASGIVRDAFVTVAEMP